MSNPTPVNISLTLRPEELGLNEVEIQNSNSAQPVSLFKKNRKARLRLGSTLSVVENPGDAPILKVADDKFTTIEEFNILEKHVHNLDLNPKHSHEYTDITGEIAGLVGKITNGAGHMQMVTLCDDFEFNEEGQLVLSAKGIEDAPMDGESYMRRNGMWEQVQYLTDPEIVEIVYELSNKN